MKNKRMLDIQGSSVGFVKSCLPSIICEKLLPFSQNSPCKCQHGDGQYRFVIEQKPITSKAVTDFYVTFYTFPHRNIWVHQTSS